MGTIEQGLDVSLAEALREARIAAGFPRAKDAADATGYREKDFYRWESMTNPAEPQSGALIRLWKLYYPHLDLNRIRDKGRLLSVVRELVGL